MVSIFKKKTQKDLEDLILKTRSSMQNNYKDMAQDFFKDFCKKYDELMSIGALNDKQIENYKKERDILTEELKGFTHKDQKPYWH
ncbi:MAG: hypothetical protein Q4D29_04215 [Lachnospiraceae bacterium]|nr:hypothetical protein [Lachnospiraceae bacterium]